MNNADQVPKEVRQSINHHVKAIQQHARTHARKHLVLTIPVHVLSLSCYIWMNMQHFKTPAEPQNIN